MEFWNIYTLYCKYLKRAHLPDNYFCVLNLPQMKYHDCGIHSIKQTWYYHLCVIVSRRRDLALTDILWSVPFIRLRGSFPCRCLLHHPFKPCTNVFEYILFGNLKPCPIITQIIFILYKSADFLKNNVAIFVTWKLKRPNNLTLVTGKLKRPK